MASLLTDQDATAMALVFRAVHQRQSNARGFLSQATNLQPPGLTGPGDWVLTAASDADIQVAVAFLARTTATGVPDGGA